MKEGQKCKNCGKFLILCPLCHGDDPYGGEGQGGYYICQTEDCPLNGYDGGYCMVDDCKCHDILNALTASRAPLLEAIEELKKKV